MSYTVLTREVLDWKNAQCIGTVPEFAIVIMILEDYNTVTTGRISAHIIQTQEQPLDGLTLLWGD